MKIIFIASSGRSGSQSLATALGEVFEVQAFHDMHEENYICKKYLESLKEVKKRRLNLITATLDAGYHYVECSVCTRCHLEDLTEDYPDCTIVHLVRDGRDYVRSGMGRPWFKKDKNQFSEICKLWALGQRTISKCPSEIVRLEDLIKGPIGWFVEKLGLKYNEITLPHDHLTKNLWFPHWTEWDENQVDIAKKWMGEELEKFGYVW